MAQIDGQTGYWQTGLVLFRFGDHALDLSRVELRRSDAIVGLEPQVFDVLAYLVMNRDRMVTKEEILDNVWGDRFVGESALSSRIAAARRAIGDDGRKQALIKTVHGRGFRFVAEVEEASAIEVDAPSEENSSSMPSPGWWIVRCSPSVERRRYTLRAARNAAGVRSRSVAG